MRFVADTIRPQLAPKRLVLEVQVPASLPLVRADIEKTTWVLLSLLANAIRYAHSQDTLRIGASVLPAGGFVQVRVQDQGPGIAREFITSQGGQLWVESTVGTGSMFSFTLPHSAGYKERAPPVGARFAKKGHFWRVPRRAGAGRWPS
ncbi:MAG: hypothetical protein EOO36_22005 [Cytophagaceae bacterium]|nr:MAG: hypothetical protein EOO36_22005 [Cytophagaceae bacterium]